MEQDDEYGRWEKKLEELERLRQEGREQEQVDWLNNKCFWKIDSFAVLQKVLLFAEQFTAGQPKLQEAFTENYLRTFLFLYAYYADSPQGTEYETGVALCEQVGARLAGRGENLFARYIRHAGDFSWTPPVPVTVRSLWRTDFADSLLKLQGGSMEMDVEDLEQAVIHLDIRYDKVVPNNGFYIAGGPVYNRFLVWVAQHITVTNKNDASSVFYLCLAHAAEEEELMRLYEKGFFSKKVLRDLIECMRHSNAEDLCKIPLLLQWLHEE